MRVPLLLLLAAASCATADTHPTPSDPRIAELRRFENVTAPTPPVIPELDGIWWVGRFGEVVVFDRGMVAIRMEKPDEWPEDVLHLLLPIANGRVGSGIKGDAVVVGRIGDVLACRYHRNPLGSGEPPAAGDEAWVDFSTSFAMQRAWRESANGGDPAAMPQDATGRSSRK
jgi:hypothetical protein